MTQTGHTLLEVVVSVLLLAVGLVPLLQLYPPLLSAAQSQQQTELLASAASAKLEELAQALRGGSFVGAGRGFCAAVPGCVVEWDVRDVATDPTAGWLRHVRVAACADANGNLACDAGEEQVAYETRVTGRP